MVPVTVHRRGGWGLPAQSWTCSRTLDPFRFVVRPQFITDHESHLLRFVSACTAPNCSSRSFDLACTSEPKAICLLVKDYAWLVEEVFIGSKNAVRPDPVHQKTLSEPDSNPISGHKSSTRPELEKFFTNLNPTRRPKLSVTIASETLLSPPNYISINDIYDN